MKFEITLVCTIEADSMEDAIATWEADGAEFAEYSDGPGTITNVAASEITRVHEPGGNGHRS